MICIDREDPSLPYVALKNKLMHCHNKDWGLEDAGRLLQRIVDALDEDCVVVKEYFEKLRLTLLAKKDDPDFTKLQGFFLLSMGLSKPHQLAFDAHMRTIRDTRNHAALLEPFDKALRAKMMSAQKKHLTGDSKQLPLGDLSKNEYRKCGLIATHRIRPEEPKPVAKPKQESNKKTPKPVKAKTPKKEKKQTKSKAEDPPKPAVEQPAPKKAKKVKVPDNLLEEVLGSLQELKVSTVIPRVQTSLVTF